MLCFVTYSVNVIQGRTNVKALISVFQKRQLSHNFKILIKKYLKIFWCFYIIYIMGDDGLGLNMA